MTRGEERSPLGEEAALDVAALPTWAPEGLEMIAHLLAQGNRNGESSASAADAGRSAAARFLDEWNGIYLCSVATCAPAGPRVTASPARFRPDGTLSLEIRAGSPLPGDLASDPRVALQKTDHHGVVMVVEGDAEPLASAESGDGADAPQLLDVRVRRISRVLYYDATTW